MVTKLPSHIIALEQLQVPEFPPRPVLASLAYAPYFAAAYVAHQRMPRVALCVWRQGESS